MAIKDILKKLEGVDGIEASDIEELKVLDKPSDEKNDKSLKDAKATAARILEEKKKLQEKAAELEAELEAVKSGGLSEVEKAQKELDKFKKASEKTEAELAQVKAELAGKSRAYKLERIGSKLSFVDTVPSDMREYAVSNAFKDIEDLDDEAAIEKVLGDFRETHKGVLASETAARGSGSVGGMQSENRGQAKSPEKMTDSERQKHLRTTLRERSSI